jgi:CubicO group peptidase (beta-lactamase class C family)
VSQFNRVAVRGVSLINSPLRSASPQQSVPTGPQDTLASHIPRLAAGALDFQPGSRWRYSGVACLDVLARGVEIASGKFFDQFLRRRIFEPLGMKDTFFVLPDDRKERLASVYEITDKGLTKASFKMIPLPRNYFSGAIGLDRNIGS